jgi:hypothetical protein
MREQHAAKRTRIAAGQGGEFLFDILEADIDAEGRHIFAE